MASAHHCKVQYLIHISCRATSQFHSSVVMTYLLPVVRVPLRLGFDLPTRQTGAPTLSKLARICESGRKLQCLHCRVSNPRLLAVMAASMSSHSQSSNSPSIQEGTTAMARHIPLLGFCTVLLGIAGATLLPLQVEEATCSVRPKRRLTRSIVDFDTLNLDVLIQSQSVGPNVSAASHRANSLKIDKTLAFRSKILGRKGEGSEHLSPIFEISSRMLKAYWGLLSESRGLLSRALFLSASSALASWIFEEQVSPHSWKHARAAANPGQCWMNHD